MNSDLIIPILAGLVAAALVIRRLTRPEPIDKMKARLLDEARRQLLQHEDSAAFHDAQAMHLRSRIERLATGKP